jgi:poly(3-hydroxybutyrate) depolymerase
VETGLWCWSFTAVAAMPRPMPNFTRFDDLADREGFLVVYPESFQQELE